MTVYFIYAKIPSKIYDERIKFIISNVYDYRFRNGYMYGLYAWTKKKKIYKEFIELRNNGNIYTVIKKDDIDDDQFKEIKDTYFQLELKSYRYFHKTESSEDEDNSSRFMEVVSTKNEYNICTNEFSEYINEFGPKVKDGYPDYLMFSPDVIEALDIIGYTTDYDITQTTGARKEKAIENFQEGKTVLGRDLFVTGENELTNLLFLFYFMFFGDVEQKEINEEFV